jgi:hypothetical protein
MAKSNLRNKLRIQRARREARELSHVEYTKHPYIRIGLDKQAARELCASLASHAATAKGETVVAHGAMVTELRAVRDPKRPRKYGVIRPALWTDPSRVAYGGGIYRGRHQ